MPNLRYSFSDTHIKLREDGWSREVTARELPASKTIAGVNLRLSAGGVRELRWHKEAERAFMLAGKARITAMGNDGRSQRPKSSWERFNAILMVFPIPIGHVRDWYHQMA